VRTATSRSDQRRNPGNWPSWPACWPWACRWTANTDPPLRRELTDPFFTGAVRAWEQAAVNARAFFTAWLGGRLAAG
jgi:hypothetical protein